MEQLEIPEGIEEKNKNRVKTYSVSLLPKDVEAVKSLGYTPTDVAKIGVKTVLFQKNFLFSHLPSISTQIGFGLILLSFSFLVSNIFFLSYILIFSSIVFISSAFVSMFYLFKFRNEIKPKIQIRRKNG